MKYAKCCRNCEYAYLTPPECKGCAVFGKGMYENFKFRTELEKIENGTLIELPCKVGDTVYYLCDDKIYEYTVDKIGCDRDGWYFNVDDEDHFDHYFDDDTEIGVEIFFDKSAAEAKLKELKGESE